MAFPVAAQAGTIGGFIVPGLTPRAPVPAPYPVIHARNDTNTRNNTVNLFVEASGNDYEFAASIVEACVETTVYAIQCTKGTVPKSVLLSGVAASEVCGPKAAPATLTIGQTDWIFSSAVEGKAMGETVKIDLQETCKLDATTAATCSATVSASAVGKSTQTSSTTALSGTDYLRFDVEITGGAEKTASPTACTGAGANLNPKKMALWALAGVLGVASFM